MAKQSKKMRGGKSPIMGKQIGGYDKTICYGKPSRKSSRKRASK